MKKFLFVLALILVFALPCFAGEDDPFPPPPTGKNPSFDSVRLRQYTVATLPATPTTGDRAEIIDGASTTDCTVGGGTDIVTCRYNGAAWANVGDGQAAGSAEVQNEAYSAANFAADVTHAPTQKIFYDFWHLVDLDDDGVITDSELSIAGLTLTGANGLALGAAGTTLGTARWYTNVAENAYHFDLFSSDFTQNWGIRWQTGYPTVDNALFNVDMNGTGGWTDPATFQAAATAATDSEVAALQTDDLWTISGLTIGAVHFGAFTGTTIADNQTLKTILQSLESAIEGIGVGGLSDLDDLPGDTVDNNLIDNALLSGDFGGRSDDFQIPSAAGLTPTATINFVINETTGGVEFYDGGQARTLSRGDHTHSGTYQPADGDLDTAAGAGAASSSTYFGKDAGGTVGFHALPAGITDTIGWDYTALSSAPGSPVAGKVYRADNEDAGWDPITYTGTTDYFVLYTGAAYIGIVDLSGNLLIDSIPVSALDVAANVATFLGSADFAAMRTNLSLVVGTNVQAYDADLDDLADGSLTGSKVGDGIDDDYVSFDDADSLWTATKVGPALEELNDSINAGAPNGSGAKVHWSQLLGVPAGFADGSDDGAGGVPAAITVADTTDSTSYVALFESATGDLGPKSDAGITYDASTGNLTVTGATIGALTGVNSIDATGAVDMDYGSADVTDHTFVSDGGTIILDGTITFPNSETIGNGDDTEISFNGTEALALDLDTGTANQVQWKNRTTSSTGVTEMNFSSLNLVTTGTILGAVNIVTTTDGTESPTAEQMYGTMFIADHGTATSDTDYTLPSAVAGMTACFYDNGGGTGGIIIDAASGDEILLDGTGVGAADAIDSPGVAGDGANGDFICLMAIDATYWITLGRSGTWVDGGAD